MKITDFLTKYEMKSHNETFSKELKNTNLPLFLSMQIIYGQSLERYIEECPEEKKDNLLLNEMKINKELIDELKKLYEVKYPGKLIFTNADDTDAFIDKKLAQSAEPILKKYTKRSKMHEILKKKKIDLIYVY